MNVALFKEAQEAYARGDYETALNGFIDCVRDTKGLSPSDLSKFYHLIGNCYVKSGDPYAAASAYTHALQISPEKRKPSLYVNLGTALLGTKEYGDALTAFTRALDYPIYTTPYKAYAGIGAAQLKLGNMTEAGAAYREAALDPTNPDPAKALVNLGVCFMELGRAKDAITSYETALEFNLTPAAAAKAHANLGQAYLAEGRVNKSIEAFEAATADGAYELSPMARHDYEIAKTLHERIEARVPGVLDTGFIPPVTASTASTEDDTVVDEPTEMPLDGSGHLPVYGEPNFDPFAPQTQAMDVLPKDGGHEKDADSGKADAHGDSAAASEQQAPKATDAPSDTATGDPSANDAPEGDDAAEHSVASPRRHPQLHHVDADGVDEAELEKTLVELGIAPEQTKVPWESDSATKEEAESPARHDWTRADHAVGEADADDAEAAADAAEDTDESHDPSTEKTELLTPVTVGAGIDIPTGKVPRTPEGDIPEGDGSADSADEHGSFDAAEAADETVPFESYDAAEGEDGAPLWEDDDYADATQEFSPDGIVSEAADSGEPLKLENTDTHMPSPEDTQFFEKTEKEIKQDAKQARRKARKSRGVGLKVALVIVILAVIVAGAGAAAYIMGYGYPTQEHVARSFFSAVENGSDTSTYWAGDVEQSSRQAQVAPLQKLNSYHVEAVQRSMQQTVVYLKGTLEEGGQVDYEVVMSRKGLSWAIERVELYFPSQQ